MNAIGMGREGHLDQVRMHESPLDLRAQAADVESRHAKAMRALGKILRERIDEAQRYARAIKTTAREAGITVWRRVEAALEGRMDQTPKRLRALATRVREAGTATERALKPALEARIDQVLTRLKQFGAAARGLGITARRAAGPLLETGIDQARRCARAIGAAAWQARTDRFVLSGCAAIAIAVGAWLVMMPDRPAPPDVARSPKREHPRAGAGAPAATELSQIPHPLEIARPPQPPPAPDVHLPDASSPAALAPLPARLKPAARAPTLAARLKPGTSQRSTLSAPAHAGAQPASQPQQPTDGHSKTADPSSIDTLLNRMYSDGLGHSLSRRRHSSTAPAMLPR